MQDFGKIKIMQKENEDSVFKGYPCGSKFVICILCHTDSEKGKPLDISNRGLKYHCQQHAQSAKHRQLIKERLSAGIKLNLKYEVQKKQTAIKSEDIAKLLSLEDDSLNSYLRDTLEESEKKNRTSAVEGK